MKRFAHHTEVRPCGTQGLVMARGDVDLADCLAAPMGEHCITIWEPLPTKAPGPNLCSPWCCYCFPYVTRGPHPWGSPRTGWHWEPTRSSYFEWDRIDSRLQWDDVVRFGGREFRVHSGSVRWTSPRGQRRRWWMTRYARERKDGEHGRSVATA